MKFLKRVLKMRLSTQILIAMVLGIVFGLCFPAEGVSIKILGDIFLRMIKMIIVPLVFTGLVLGIGGSGSLKKMGRLGLKAIIWFELATTVALTYGIVLANVIQPGANTPIMQVQEVDSIAKLASQKIDMVQNLINMIPTNVVDAMAKGNLIQLVFFSVFFGVGVGSLGERGEIILKLCDATMQAMFKVTNYVMKLTPIAVFSFMAYTMGKFGIMMLLPLAKLLLTLYLGLFLFILTVLVVACYLIKIKFTEVVRILKDPLLLAFTTASSESAMPMVMERLEKFGIPKYIVNFVIPTGYTFNLDGASIYFCMALLFVAQVYGIDLSIAQQILMLLIVMVMSKGAAGVAGTAIVVLSGALVAFNLPVEGIYLLMAVDRFGDMGRTVTNLLGNCIATFVVARWENELPDEVIESGYRQDYSSMG